MLKKPEDRRTAIALILLLAQAGVYYTVSRSEVIPVIAPWSEFPSTVGKWKTAIDSPLDREVLDALQPDDYLNREYVSGDKHVLNLFIGYFSSRRNGRAPHSPEWCLPGSGWKSVSTRVVSIPSSNGQSIPANEYIVDKASERCIVLYWYHQGERALASELLAQVYSIPDMVMHGRTDTSLIRIIIPVESNQLDAARTQAFSFAGEIYPLVRKQIR
jgi:EpsI family protein